MAGLLTWAISTVWSSLTALRRMSAKWGIVPPVKLAADDAARVVSVGNIQAGGGGKTPLVALIAREGAARGNAVCIVTRGYGGEWEGEGGLVRPNAPPPETKLCGDEAALLHDLCPAAWVAVGADRLAQFALARREAGKPFDLVVLDDGFQNQVFAKDLEIVAMTSQRRSEIPFRDFGRALRLADLVVWTKGARAPKSFGRPFARSRYRLAPGAGARVWLVTGVADEESVARSAVEAGYQIERRVDFPDHARYAGPTVRSLLEQAAAAGCRVAITGKDWVKWRELGVRADEVAVLEPEVYFDDEGRALWNRVLWGS